MKDEISRTASCIEERRNAYRIFCELLKVSILLIAMRVDWIDPNEDRSQWRAPLDTNQVFPVFILLAFCLFLCFL
jgi:hypothetical protein